MINSGREEPSTYKCLLFNLKLGTRMFNYMFTVIDEGFSNSFMLASAIRI